MMRVATPEDVGTILDWAADEGWNPGVDDAAAFYAADPHGFFVAERDGHLVAAISVVNHSDEFAFLGLYLCHPDWRGQGIGFALWQWALEHAGGRSVGLDGVAAQQTNYAKSGFVLEGSTARLEGRLRGAPDPRVRLADAADYPALATLDAAANGYDRPAFLKAWLAGSDTRRTLVTGAAEIEGFATIRLCRAGAKIGPVIAPDAPRALALIRAALCVVPSDSAIVDVPRANAGLISLLAQEGLKETFSTARMYRGTAPQTGANLQAISTMELG